MESVEGQIEPLQWKIRSVRVAVIEQHKRMHYVSGVGKDAVFEYDNVGWYARFEGSWEALFLGFEEPNLRRGDKVNIIIEKVQPNAVSK